jgi:hypothetical protein
VCRSGAHRHRTTKSHSIRPSNLALVPGSAEVEDVLGEGEPGADESTVDEAIEWAFEVASSGKNDDQEENGLHRFFEDRSLE